jgi:hypothetical protein
MALPTPIQIGDIFGHHFPTSHATHPHPGLVLNIYDDPVQRAGLIAGRNLKDHPQAQLCVVLMISHTYPSANEIGELIDPDHCTGTQLDAEKSIYACYKHFDVAFAPGQEKVIASANGPYLGRVSHEVLTHYRSQFTSVQAYLKGRSFKPPSGIIIS